MIPGCLYKYRIATPSNQQFEKADPVGFFCETPPQTASVVWPLDYEWHDQDWMVDRHRYCAGDSPMSVYEMHLGSWRRKPDGTWLTYRELAPQLSEYLKQTGFTHVEFMPLCEHPFYGSWIRT